MFNGSRFFNLARKWQDDENILPLHFKILQAAMDHYFGCIAGYKNYSKRLLEIDSAVYSVIDIEFVLDSVGYRNYSIQRFKEVNKTQVILRNSL